VSYKFEADSDIVEKIQARLTHNDAVHLQHYQRLS
jgi:hypothetical protein